MASKKNSLQKANLSREVSAVLKCEGHGVGKGRVIYTFYTKQLLFFAGMMVS
ncbi:hypothetical protein [Neisseria zoodegmatis]|uniref:hypothetical protein n=1 Tax=Neisseria zoodegmatis TaxID=326523 RepID=UPI0015F00D0A|nr:hypothetical protein [Neisseria zoodegmatis]